MSVDSAAAVAFARPGGESCVPSKARPVDLVHLARQTLGDRALEEEVLALFMSQTSVLRERIAKAVPEERRRLAHSLKGSARSVGAFTVAECAARIESEPANRAHLRQLAQAIEEVREFVAAINR